MKRRSMSFRYRPTQTELRKRARNIEDQLIIVRAETTSSREQKVLWTLSILRYMSLNPPKRGTGCDGKVNDHFGHYILDAICSLPDIPEQYVTDIITCHLYKDSK